MVTKTVPETVPETGDLPERKSDAVSERQNVVPEKKKMMCPNLVPEFVLS